MSDGESPFAGHCEDQTHGAHPRIGPWSITSTTFARDTVGHFEALFAVGNGLWVTRGAAVEAERDEPHYPGTYRAGLYDRRIDWVEGEAFEHEDLVNLPNWLDVRWRRPGGAWVLRGQVELLKYEQHLCLQRGVLTVRWAYRDDDGGITRVEERRLVHMALPHVAAVELTLFAENWSGTLELRSAIDGRVENANVRAYAGTDGNHLEGVRGERLDSATFGDACLLLQATTLGTRVQLAMSTRTSGLGEHIACVGEGREARRIELLGKRSIEPGEPVRLEKVATLFTSLDVGSSEPTDAAKRELAAAPSFGELLAAHEGAWARLWQSFAIDIEGQPQVTGALRFHLFQLIQTLSPHTCTLDVGIPGRGWHGEGYRGHVFWDELFVFPLLVVRLPELARALLLYRYRRLPEARRAAAAAGFQGALFPWRSASDGREVTEPRRKNPRSGRWIPDHSRLQRHINAAVAYNVWRYFEVTRDWEFFDHHGAELLLETAQLWVSAAQWDEARQRFVIRGVVGPDEFHDAYPGAQRPGIDNNAYTNLMAVWNVERGLDVLRLVSEERAAELRERLHLTDAALDRWRALVRRMFVPFADGIIEQFEGFARLEPFPWHHYVEKYGDIHRLDDILEAEGSAVSRFQACKQADVLMLFHLLSEREVASLLAGLGYESRSDLLETNLAYYLERTCHGSTLSRVVHASVLARSDRRHSWDMLKQALGSDLGDIQNGTTKEGLHLGAMAGSVDVFQSCYLGLQFRGGELWVDPTLPDGLDGLSMRLRVQAAWLEVRLQRPCLTIDVQADARHDVLVRFGKIVVTLAPGESHAFQLE